ncbi:hypothetical protein ACP4OV_029322 [Aristida adscensionis]
MCMTLRSWGHWLGQVLYKYLLDATQIGTKKSVAADPSITQQIKYRDRLDMASPPALHPSNAEETRKACTFHPTLWGDFFLTYQPPTTTQQACMKERAEVLIEEVRKIVKGSNELPETLNIIITLQRLGLDYFYETEIEQILSVVYESDYNDKDLYLVSLRFYLLRKNGYDVSSDTRFI